jgi:VanZ family protein
VAALLAHYRALARIAAWVAIFGIIILSVVPASDRPTFGEWWFDEWTGHVLEHFSAFAILGVAFTIGYYRLSLPQLLFLALSFSAGIELLQALLPTRHARFSDFVIDFVALCIATILVRATIDNDIEQRA